MPTYINPLSLVVLAGSIPLGVFVTIFAFKQTGLISQGITTKQQKSIMLTGGYQNQQISCKDKLFNIYAFLTRSKPDSLINIRL
jgi:hypothetical protein